MSHTSPYKPYLRTSNSANPKTPNPNLFMSMSEIERSRDDQGIMNLGQNCTLCNQLDFLPFHCEFCNGTFCSAHRTLDVHKCVGRPQKAPQNPEKGDLKSNFNSDSIANGETAASLFPDRAKHQKSLDASIEALGSAVAAKSKAKSTPVMKLTKFLHLQRLKRESQKKSISLFGKKKTPAVSLTAEVAKIKKVAKGPSAVSVADRVYAWVLFVNRNESEFGDISEEKERKAVWVSKNWSVGRALDAIAETMNIMNHNNSTRQSEERLNLFKVEKEVPVALVSSVKVGTGIPNGATLYLVKGAA